MKTDTAAPADSSVRVGDVEREACVERLTDNFVRGRLSADELDRRHHEALAAITVADLARLVVDLPAADSADRSWRRPGSEVRVFWPSSGRDCVVKLATMFGVPATFATGGALVAAYADGASDVSQFSCAVGMGALGYLTHWGVAKFSR